MPAGVNYRKAAVIAIALLLIASVLMLAASCGQKSATGGTSPTTVQKSIDSYLKELDRDANSVDPNGYGDSQLGNSALGL